MRTALFKLSVICALLLGLNTVSGQIKSDTSMEYILDGSFDKVKGEFINQPHPHTAFSHTSFGPIWHTNLLKYEKSTGMGAKEAPHFARGRYLTVYISDQHTSTAKRQGFYIRLVKPIEPNTGIYQLEFDMASLLGDNPPVLVVNRMYQPFVISSGYSKRFEKPVDARKMHAVDTFQLGNPDKEGQHVVVRIDTEIEGFSKMDHLVFTNGGSHSGAFQKVAFDNFTLKRLPDYSLQKRAEEVITIKKKGKKKKPSVIDIFRDKQF